MPANKAVALRRAGRTRTLAPVGRIAKAATVDAGTVLVDQAGATMDGIVKAVRQVAEIMREISAASTEQSTGIEQVNQAIVSIDDVTQQNAALVEEAAAAAQSMRDQAALLAQAVGIFKLAPPSRPVLAA